MHQRQHKIRSTIKHRHSTSPRRKCSTLSSRCHFKPQHRNVYARLPSAHQSSCFSTSASRPIASHLISEESNTDSSQPMHSVYKYQSINSLVPYRLAHEWMEALLQVKGRKVDPELRDILFIVQHKPVYTLGKKASLENFKFDLPSCFSEQQTSQQGLSSTNQFPFDVQRTERGGEVTYHGPGQLTVYPILNLNNYKRDLHWYVAQLESVVLLTLEHYGVRGTIDPENPGVWVNNGQAKIAALGCRFSRWITQHGFSFNITPEVHEGFNRIVPCGIQNRGVTSLHDVLLKHSDGRYTQDNLPSMEQVAEQIQQSFAIVFNSEVIVDDPAITQHYQHLLEQDNLQ